jgi:hypothetical protein
MNLFELQTDPDKDSKGTWIEYPDHTSNGAEPAHFLIASTGSKEYRKALNMEVRKRFHRKWLEDIESRDEAEIQAMAKTVLLSWKGAVYLTPDRTPTPFTRENAIKALRIPAFKTWVEAEAGNLDNFQIADKAADVAALKSGAAVGT